MKRNTTDRCITLFTLAVSVVVAISSYRLYFIPGTKEGDLGKYLATKAIKPIKPILLRGREESSPPVSEAWHSALPRGVGFCDAAKDPGKYAKPEAQLLQSTSGWVFQKDELSWSSRNTGPDVHKTVRELVKYLARTDTKLIILISPPRVITGAQHLDGIVTDSRRAADAELGYTALLEAFRRDGAYVPDILAEARFGGVPLDQLSDPADLHWTALGAKIAAWATARIVQADDRVGTLAPQRVKISRAGKPVMVSDYYRILEQICETENFAPLVPSYMPVETVAISSKLLETGSPVSTFIVGTSFTALDHRYNFSGYLAEATGVATVNLSISGGGPVQALLEYLASGVLQRDRPTFLVWELTPGNMPVHDSLSQIGAYISEGCREPIVVERNLRVSNLLLFSEKELHESGRRMVKLSLASSNPALRNFAVIVDKYDGSSDSIEINFSRAKSASGEFEVVLPELADVKAISLDPRNLIEGHVTAKLCRLSA